MSSKILTALLLVGGASAVYAGPVYSCGGGSACDGNLYAVWMVSQTATSYVLDVGVQATSNYLAANGGTGSNTDFINALSIIPDTSNSMTAASLTGHGAGVWGLQAGSGTGPCSGTAAPYICAGASGMGANLFTYTVNGFIPTTQIWQFTITGTPPSLGDTATIKLRYINSIGTTATSPGSLDFTIQCVDSSDCSSSNSAAFADVSAVPEPTTSALIGSGLAGLYFIRRRLQR